MKKIFHKKPIKTSTAQKDPRMEDDKRRKKTDNEEIWRKLKKDQVLKITAVTVMHETCMSISVYASV